MKSNGNKKILATILTAVLAVVIALSGYLLIAFIGSSVQNGSPSLNKDLDNNTQDSDSDIDDANKDDDLSSDEEGSDKSASDVESRRTKNYDGPRICQADQYIYNSDGKIIKDFHDGERYYLEMTVNADASEAVLVYDNVCYYIDADLNMTEIETDVNDAGICFDGGYCYYVTGEVGTTDQELFIYDIWNQTKESIYTGNIITVCISPNGQVVAFSTCYGKPGLYTDGIDIKARSYNIDNDPSLIAISNDASMIYYNEFGGKDDEFKCIDHGQEVTLSTKRMLESYFDKECKQIMYMDKEGVKYYKTESGEPVIITEDTEELHFDVARGISMPISFFSEHYILDTDCFSDALMMHSFDDCYAFTGLVPEIICLTSGNEKARNFSMAITDEGPTCIGTSEGNLVKFSYDGKEITETTLYITDELSLDYVASRNLDKIWFIKNNNVYYFTQKGEPPVLVGSQGNKTSFDLKWDPFSDRCFFIKDDMYLCSAGTETDDVEIICDYCHIFTYVPGEDNLVGFYGHNSDTYFLIGDEILEM